MIQKSAQALLNSYFTMKKLIFLGLILTLGCETQETQNIKDWSNDYTLKMKDRWVISIDLETKRNGNLYSYNEYARCLFLFNQINQSIYSFPLSDSTFSQRIEFDKDGPNGLTTVTHFLFHNKDSIFFFNDLSNTLRIANEKGIVYFKKQILETNEPSFIPKVAKMQIDGHELVMPVFGHQGTRPDLQSKSLLIYNLHTGQKDFLMDLPTDSQGYFGDKTVSKNLALIDDMYTMSLSMSSVIQTLSKVSSHKPVQEQKYSSERIHYPTEFKEDLNDRQAAFHYQMTNSWNESLFFDKNSRTLLRSVVIGRNLDKNHVANSINNSLSLNSDRVFVLTELFNESMKKIGEVDHVVFYDGIFSNESYIYMVDYEFDLFNEDIIVFSKYQIEPNVEK